MTASSEFQVAFLSGTYYYTNVKPYFRLEWLKLLSLPHTCHKPRSCCWRQTIFCYIVTSKVWSLEFQHDTNMWQVHSFGRKRPPFTPNQASWHEADEQKIWWGREVLLLIDWLIYPVIFFPVKIHKSCSQIFRKPWNNASMSKPKKIIWVLVLRLETCTCSKTDAKIQGGTKQVIRVLDIEFESSWICSKTMKQGEWVQENQVKWVLVLRFYI